jgi:hypothetical protein
MPARPARLRAYHFATARPQGLAVVSPVTDAAGPGRLTDAKPLPFGPDNNLPQQWLDMALQSGSAYACLEKRKAFLEGQGLPPQLARTPVPGTRHTAADLWSQLCSYGGTFRGVALLIRYTAAGTIGEVHLLPFGQVRKTAAGTLLFNRHFGRSGYRAADDTEHLPFDPAPATVAELLAKANKKKPDSKEKHGQPGQILYAYVPQAGEEDYPLPAGYAGRQDLETDAEYARFDLEEVRNGFFPNTIITLLGAPAAKTQDENGETQDERTDDEIRDFTGNGSSPLGRKKVLVLEAVTKELAPIVSTFDGGHNLEKLIAKRPAVAEAVCRHMGILPILIGLNTAGKLGQSQEIMNAVELTQDALTPLRELLLRVLRQVLPGNDWQVGNKKPISFLPPEVYKTLTPKEIRKVGGYAADSGQNDTLATLNSMAPHVATAVMAQMSAAQILELVGLTPPATPAPVSPAAP